MTTPEIPEKTLTWEEVSIHIDLEEEDTIAEVKSDQVDDNGKEKVKDGYDIEDGRGESSNNQPKPIETSHYNHSKPTQQSSAIGEDEVSEFCDETIIYIGRDVPNKIIVEKKEDRDDGCTQTVISELTRPDAKRRRRNRRRRRRRRRRIRIICSLIILLTLVFVTILILIFTGILNNPFIYIDRGGDDSGVDTSVAAVSPRMPSTPARACVKEVNSQYTTFGSVPASSNTLYPPNVAIEGKNSVVVSNRGDVKFYTLIDDVWQEIDSFINVNTAKSTPAVSISGTTVVVGYLYHDTEVEQGGVHVYEQNTDGRWERVDIFDPASAVDSTAKYGWSVDVSSTPSNTIIVVGSPGESSVYVYQRNAEGGSYDSIGKLKSQTCQSNFGYAVAVHGNIIAATTDCKYIVQLYEHTDSNTFRVVQNIRYVNFEHGAVSRLQMNEQELVYSTVFGAVSIFRRAGSSRNLPFSLDEQVDVSVDNITEYPLSMDTNSEILVVGKGNSYMVLPKLTIEGSFFIENKAIEDGTVSSVAVSGNVVLASSMSDIIQYNVESCTGALPTQSPTAHSGPILSDSDISSSSSQTVTRPELPDDSSKEETTVDSKIPAALPAELGPSSICHPLEVSIVFDNSSLGIGYVITNVDTVESLSYFPPDNSVANQKYNERLCLEEGRYTFVLYDTIGNGLCCDNGNGSYRVASNGITLAQGAQFTYSDETSFELPI